MDTSARRRKVQKKVVSDSLGDLYPHDVSFYKVPPSNDIVLSEFEDLAFERLQLLRIIDQASLKGHKLFSEDWRKCIKEDLTKGGLKKYVRLLNGGFSNTEQDFQARRADHISHFILRLAYCRSEELRRWFLHRELDWFKLRFLSLNNEGIKKFLKINNLTYTPISRDEKENLKSELIVSTPAMNEILFESTDFYKVYFTEVVSLVKARKVYLKAGYAYVSTSNLVVCVQTTFRASLNEALHICFRRIPYFDDDRINPLLSNLHNAYTGNNYTVRDDVNSIDPANIDMYSKKHYPLCMRHVHAVLRANHHLKHKCRLQYGLFLKAIGLLYEDALRFWRDEFTKVMDSSKFEKEHVYNIKHSYGKVGKMISYSPYSCMKIIMESVGPGEHHGCPFKQWDPANIKQKMIEHGLSNEDASQIKDLVSNHHYQVACGKYFELTHGKAPLNGISHPNQYFEQSMDMEKENK